MLYSVDIKISPLLADIDNIACDVEELIDLVLFNTRSSCEIWLFANLRYKGHLTLVVEARVCIKTCHAIQLHSSIFHLVENFKMLGSDWSQL